MEGKREKIEAPFRRMSGAHHYSPQQTGMRALASSQSRTATTAPHGLFRFIRHASISISTLLRILIKLARCVDW